MNALMNPNTTEGPLTMTSREIADLVDSRHDKVKQSIERLAERGAISLPPLGEVSNDGPGPKTISVYLVGKRDSYVIVAQLSPEFTARLVDRWQELESAARAPAAHLSRVDILKLALDSEEKRLALEHQVSELAPKAAALDRFTASEDAVTMTQAAKLLGVKRETLTNWMNANGWIYRQNGTWVPYRQHIENGRLQYKEAHYTDEKTGQECLKPYCHIFPKGLAKLAEVFANPKPVLRLM